MPIDFPNSPTTGQVYTYLGKSWIWNGTGWDSIFPSFGDASLPAGSILQWASNSTPSNWLICDGAAVSRSTFPSLFAAIGTAYGAGDGTTTFNLPDLRGRVGVGRDSTQTEFDVLGETGGAKTHTLTTAQMPSHTHTGSTNTTGNHSHLTTHFNSSFRTPAGTGGELAALDGPTYGQNRSSTDNGSHSHSFTTDATGGGGAHNNLQPYQVINYIIKTSAGTTAGDSELATRLGAAEAAVGQRPLSDNLIINGAFDIWQRGTSFTASSSYTADRFVVDAGTVTRQAGTAGLPYCLRIANSSINPAVRQGIELPVVGNAGEFIPGSTWTFSFYARTSTSVAANIGVYAAFATNIYNSAVEVHNATNVGASSTNWTRYSRTFTVSASPGGTNTALVLTAYLNSGAYAGNFEITGIELEAGTVATAFRRNSPSIQAELAACQRYYYRVVDSSNVFGTVGFGWSTTTTAAQILTPFPVSMRRSPSSVEFGNLLLSDGVGTVAVTALTMDGNITTPNYGACAVSGTGQTQFRPIYLRQNNNTAGFLAFSAEL